MIAEGPGLTTAQRMAAEGPEFTTALQKDRKSGATARIVVLVTGLGSDHQRCLLAFAAQVDL
jgi:hypothetical protein